MENIDVLYVGAAIIEDKSRFRDLKKFLRLRVISLRKEAIGLELKVKIFNGYRLD
jgi:hypothetical protein